jgi:toxin-antitoxin system PIN domain toxin
VILIDANILVYAHVRSFPQHDRARAWLDDRLNGAAPVGLPWQSLIAFLRLVTNPRVFAQPEPIADAWRQVSAWLDGDRTWIPQPSERHREILGGLAVAPGIQANLVHDAHLAALAIEHGLILCSTDGDFARFPDLRWENPLREATPAGA